jgi:hypothetical protein
VGLPTVVEHKGDDERQLLARVVAMAALTDADNEAAWLG